MIDLIESIQQFVIQVHQHVAILEIIQEEVQYSLAFVAWQVIEFLEHVKNSHKDLEILFIIVERVNRDEDLK